MNLSLDDRYVFLFAHPDDDAFISGTMHFLIQRGAHVHGIWVTSGDYFGKGAVRERELRNATALLGLEDSHVHLLRFPDLGVLRELDRAASTLTELIGTIRPDKAFSNAFEGGHPDHDCVNFLAYEACFRAGVDAELFEFPLYNAAGKFYHWWWRINSFPPGGPSVRHIQLPDDSIRCRQRMPPTYPSQWMYMFPLRLASTRRRLAKVGEPFRPCPRDRDHTLRPHEGMLSYERWFNAFMKISFDDFRKAILETRSFLPTRSEIPG